MNEMPIPHASTPATLAPRAALLRDDRQEDNRFTDQLREALQGKPQADPARQNPGTQSEAEKRETADTPAALPSVLPANPETSAPDAAAQMAEIALCQAGVAEGLSLTKQNQMKDFAAPAAPVPSGAAADLAQAPLGLDAPALQGPAFLQDGPAKPIASPPGTVSSIQGGLRPLGKLAVEQALPRGDGPSSPGLAPVESGMEAAPAMPRLASPAVAPSRRGGENGAEVPADRALQAPSLAGAMTAMPMNTRLGGQPQPEAAGEAAPILAAAGVVAQVASGPGKKAGILSARLTEVSLATTQASEAVATPFHDRGTQAARAISQALPEALVMVVGASKASDAVPRGPAPDTAFINVADKTAEDFMLPGIEAQPQHLLAPRHEVFAPMAAAREAAAPAPARQVAPVVVALTLRGDDGALTVALDPVELGKVEVSIGQGQDAGQIRIVAERPETLALLQRDHRELDRALNQAGLGDMARSLSFSLASQDNKGGQGFAQQGHGVRHGTSLPATEAARHTPSLPPPPRAAAISLLDIAV